MDEYPIQQPIESPKPQHSKRIFWIVVIAVVVLGLVAVGIMFWVKRHPAVQTPGKTLDDLRLTSGPDIKTDAQKKATVDALAKSSQPAKLNSDQQMQLLNSLSQ